MILANRNAIVTGGAHRLGAAIVRDLTKAGVNVFVHYFNSGTAAKALASELCTERVTVVTGKADLSDPSCASGLIATATAKLGPISLLVNNASNFPENTLANTTIKDWHTTIDTSLSSPIFLTQAFAESLPPDIEGSVVNITDSRTRTPYIKHFTYAVAKGGVDTFTRAAAVALGPQIRVNAVAPGIVLPPPGENNDYIDRMAEALPLRQPGSSESIAHAVRALLENDFITGEILNVDGGGKLTTASNPPNSAIH